MNTYKVIFHVDELPKWKLVLTNTKNLLDALIENTLVIEILANSEAVKFFIETDNVNQKQLLDLVSNNVIFTACNNSLTTFAIEPKSLFSFVSIVPSGVAELAIKQHAGFAYIKP